MRYEVIGSLFSINNVFFSMSYLKHLVFNKPLVTINEEGFYDNSSMIATGDRLVHWKEVKDISLRYFGGQSYITVALRDLYKTLKHEDLATRMIADYNTQYTEGEINIMLKFVTKYSDEECLMFMQNAFEEYKKKQKLSGKEDKEFAFLENTLD
nr:STM3941 family protein [Macrococcus goetzii]